MIFKLKGSFHKPELFFHSQKLTSVHLHPVKMAEVVLTSSTPTLVLVHRDSLEVPVKTVSWSDGPSKTDGRSLIFFWFWCNFPVDTSPANNCCRT